MKCTVSHYENVQEAVINLLATYLQQRTLHGCKFGGIKCAYYTVNFNLLCGGDLTFEDYKNLP